MEIAKDLIRQKLRAQEQLANEKLKDSGAAHLIAVNLSAADEARTIDSLRLLESRAAHAYWNAWSDLPVMFPKRDLARVPRHWQSFGTRVSPLTGSPRLAANPPNAVLNYLYAILESESRLAAAAMGLDPGIGVMMLDWMTSSPWNREWFFEQRDGNCRLMGPFAAQLSETTLTWRRALAPIVESVARALWSTTSKSMRSQATRLTQANRRRARGLSPILPTQTPPRPPRLCKGCGASIPPNNNFCFKCGLVELTEKFVGVARRGRLVAQGAKAQAKRSQTQRRNALAQRAWKPSDLPPWLNEKVYAERIQPRLSGIKVAKLATAICVSRSYAMDIQAGRRRPHQRHWERLAHLAGVSASA